MLSINSSQLSSVSPINRFCSVGNYSFKWLIKLLVINLWAAVWLNSIHSLNSCVYPVVILTRENRFMKRLACFRRMLNAWTHMSIKCWNRSLCLSPSFITYAMSDVRTNLTRSLKKIKQRYNLAYHLRQKLIYWKLRSFFYYNFMSAKKTGLYIYSCITKTNYSITPDSMKIKILRKLDDFSRPIFFSLIINTSLKTRISENRTILGFESGKPSSKLQTYNRT